jgi:hypothetical protein
MDAAPKRRRNHRVLVTLAELYEANIAEPDRALVAACSEYEKPTQRGFQIALTALSRAGHVTYPTGRTVRVTELGRAQVAGPTMDVPAGNADVHKRIANALTPMEREVFRELSDGRERSRHDVARAIRYTSAQVSPSPQRRPNLPCVAMLPPSLLTAVSIASSLLESRLSDFANSIERTWPSDLPIDHNLPTRRRGLPLRSLSNSRRRRWSGFWEQQLILRELIVRAGNDEYDSTVHDEAITRTLLSVPASSCLS